MLLPVAVNVEGRRVLVVGGGSVAARKIAALLECGAHITVIAPELHFEIESPFEHRARFYESDDCSGFDLAFAATNNREVNALVAREAKALGIWCNIADDPQASDFHTTGVVRRGDITIGISTQGVSPVLAKHIRERVESAISDEYAVLLELTSELAISTPKRGDFWRRVLASNVLELLRDGQRDAARQLLLNAAGSAPMGKSCFK